MTASAPPALPFRIGYGYDIHRLVPVAASGRALVLGGVHFSESALALDGHSDADVLTHAICDALLGAAGLPDIGHFFPNTDPAFKDVDSQKLLVQSCAQLRARGYQIGNIDASLVAEQPKIGPRLTEMKTRLAQSMQIAPGQVGLKATTNEGVDEIGRSRAIAAHAVALIYASQ